MFHRNDWKLICFVCTNSGDALPKKKRSAPFTVTSTQTQYRNWYAHKPIFGQPLQLCLQRTHLRTKPANQNRQQPVEKKTTPILIIITVLNLKKSGFYFSYGANCCDKTNIAIFSNVNLIKCMNEVIKKSEVTGEILNRLFLFSILRSIDQTVSKRRKKKRTLLIEWIKRYDSLLCAKLIDAQPELQLIALENMTNHHKKNTYSKIRLISIQFNHTIWMLCIAQQSYSNHIMYAHQFSTRRKEFQWKRETSTIDNTNSTFYSEYFCIYEWKENHEEKVEKI